MKHICLLAVVLLFSGCALNPKPLTFSSPQETGVDEHVTRIPYLQIIYPDELKQKKISSRSYFTGIANTLNVELGNNVYDILTEQASRYFDKVEIVGGNENKPVRTPGIQVHALHAEINGTDLSISGEMTVTITKSSGQDEQQVLSFAGEGSPSVMILGPIVARETLTKAEHQAMQMIIDKLTGVFGKMHNEIVLAQEKSIQPPSPPRENQRIAELGTFYALVIGNTEYAYLPDLESAGHDAAAVAGLLKNEYGYSVTTLYNATRAEIINSLSNYRKQLRADDNLLIYYAGHGWLDKEADEGYWLPVDADRENSVNWVSNASITTALRAMPARHIIVVADSCYSGKLTRGMDIRQRTPSFLQNISQKKARVVLSSGGLEPVLDSGGTDKHSVFASAFISLLRENTNYIDGMTLSSSLRKRVAWNAEQIPEYGIIHNAGHDGGDFIFLKKQK